MMTGVIDNNLPRNRMKHYFRKFKSGVTIQNGGSNNVKPLIGCSFSGEMGIINESIQKFISPPDDGSDWPKNN